MTSATIHRHSATGKAYMVYVDTRPHAGHSRQKGPFGWRDEGFLQAASAVLYGFVGTSMGVINRFTLKVFPLPTVLLLGQMAATLSILFPLLLTGQLKFPLFSTKRFQQLLMISFLYTANTAFALFGLKDMNLPMYTALKRLTPMTVLVIKSVWKKKWPQPRITASVSIVVVGCLVAGIGDLTFNAWAYTYALSSVVVQALYLLLVEFQGDVSGSSTSELLWYNAMQSLPLLVILTAINGDFHRVTEEYHKGAAVHGPAYFWFMVIATATMGCLLNFSLFLCTMYTSALTTTIVGVLRSVITIILGFALDTVKFHILNVTGIAINTLGGVWYTWLKYLEKYGSGDYGSRLPTTSRSSKQTEQQYAYSKVHMEEEQNDVANGADCSTVNIKHTATGHVQQYGSSV